ncbi:MAG: acyl carrier protein [Magnetococcales bacterium]|nr:acyl carrier protein [Magnetococcales bacterium]
MSMELLTTVHREILGVADLELTPTMTSRDVESWDSLAQVRLIIAIEKSFNISFDIQELANVSHVGDMVTLMQKKGCEISWNRV